MELLTGTSGYSFKEWVGPFYPDGTRPGDMLPYYASQLHAVEINNTFYRMPKSHVVEGWRDAVPSSFRFSIKASRRITHQKRLKDIEEPLEILARQAAKLEDRLGAVLFQLPPNMAINLERLRALLEAWPRELPCAVEFRHDSWLTDDTFSLLRQHEAGIVVSEDDTNASANLNVTASQVYLRLRKERYTDAMLKRWIQRLLASGAETAMVFFKHEDDGAGPRLAARMQHLAEQPRPRRAGRRAVGKEDQRDQA